MPALATHPLDAAPTPSTQMPKPTHFERTVKLYTTTIYNRDENGIRGPTVSTNLLWQALASCPPTDRSAPSPTGGANVIIEISRHSNDLAFGRLYRNRFDDLPSVGRPDETDGELQLGDNESLRSSAHFCWWELGQTKGVAGTPAEHLGLLALEIAHTAPAPSAIGLICALAQPDLGFDADVEPFMFAEHWEHLHRHPHVHEIKIKVGADNPVCPTSVGDLVTAELGQAEKLELVYRPGRGESLNVSRWLKPLREFRATAPAENSRRKVERFRRVPTRFSHKPLSGPAPQRHPHPRRQDLGA